MRCVDFFFKPLEQRFPLPSDIFPVRRQRFPLTTPLFPLYPSLYPLFVDFSLQTLPPETAYIRRCGLS